jgi:hypothetical protein
VPTASAIKASGPSGPSAHLGFADAERLLLQAQGGGGVYGPRPALLPDTEGTALHNQIFFEAEKKRRPPPSDRWRASGGLKGSTTWPLEGAPRVRRRYGRVSGPQDKEGKPDRLGRLRFLEYSLIAAPPPPASGTAAAGGPTEPLCAVPDLDPRLYQILADSDPGYDTKRKQRPPAQSGARQEGRGARKVPRLAVAGAALLLVAVALLDLLAYDGWPWRAAPDDGAAAARGHCTARSEGLCQACAPGRMLDAAFVCERADCGWSRRPLPGGMPALDDAVAWVDDAGDGAPPRG